MYRAVDHDTRLNRDDGAEGPVTIRFERRGAARHPAAGHVTLLRRGGGSQDDIRGRVQSVRLANMSQTGIAARSDLPLPLDESVAMFFAPHGPERGFDLYGRIVRCTRHDAGGYDIAVAFNLEPRPAA